jgi:hypothetical protein
VSHSSDHSDASHPLKHKPLVQSIGYDLTPPIPNPEMNGVTISAADWQFCYDVAKPALKVLVRAQLVATTPPTPPPTTGSTPAPAPTPAPTPALPGPTTMVLLEADASNDDLNAIIAWLGTFKGALMAAQTKKEIDKSKK